MSHLHRQLAKPSLVLIAAMAGGFLASLNGCGPQELEHTMPDPTIMSDATGNADLQQALDFLNRMEDFNPQQVQPKVLNHFQQWLKKQPDPKSWQPDPIAQQLQRNFSGMVSEEKLASNKFEDYDLYVLQEATWMRDLSRTIANKLPLHPYLTHQLNSEKTSPDVRVALKLFDWTCRNLQTDPDVNPGDRHRMNSDVILHAWEALLMGRGTVAEKSRVFTLLARQLRIPIVMLAVEHADARPTPWLPAAFIDGQLYLFDMRLGTPIWAQDGEQMATWQDVRSAPEVLAAMAPGDQPYYVSSSDLSQVIALVDATPAYLSKRMKTLEGALTGDNKMVLSVAPTAIAEQIIAATEIERVGIWDLPYQAFGIRSRLRASRNSPAFAALFAEHNLLDLSPLKVARVLHFRGQFQGTDDRVGAAELYLESRTSDQQIDRLGQGEQSMTAEERAQIQALLRRTKQDATYWLGLLAFDRGDYRNAINYLDKRLKPSADSRWHDGAYWNLGLAHESLGRSHGDPAQLKQAIANYQQITTGPLAPACRYRISVLSEADESTTSDEQPSNATTGDADSNVF